MRRMRTIICFLLSVSFCFISLSSIAEQTYDGYWWNALNKEQKLFFICGYNEAMEKTYQGFWIGSLVKFVEENPDKLEIIGKDRVRYVKTIYNYYMKYQQLAGFQFRQILDGIDTFYDDFRNKTIDVTNAIDVVAMQLHNKPEEEVKRFIESLRKSDREKEGYKFLEELKKE